MVFSGSTFEDNEAPSGHGGAIFLEDRNSQTDGTYVYVQGCDFQRNSALQYGGAICLFNGVFVSITNSWFEANSANYGGAIVNYDQIVYSSYSGNEFAANTASKDSTYNNIYNDSLITISQLAEEPALIDLDVSYYLSELYDNKDVTADYNTNRAEDSTICYVDASNTCAGGGSQCKDGDDWNGAYDDLQDCIDEMGPSGGEIWVAQGMFVCVLCNCFRVCLTALEIVPHTQFY